MKIFKSKMPESYELILFGDEQRGNIAMSKKDLDQCIAYILDGPNRFCIHMGDALDAFYIDDPRYDPATLKASPLQQISEFIKDMTPLVKEGRLLTCLLGNHEWSLYKKAGNLTEYACNELQKAGSDFFLGYGTYSAKIEFIDQKGLQFKTYVTHGRKSISSVSPDPVRRQANLLHILQRHLEPVFGDTLLMGMGHIHKVLISPPIPTLYLTSENGKIKQHYTRPGMGARDFYIPPQNRWYVCTGSFLKTFYEGVSTYSEMFQYAPIEIGYIKAIIQDRELVDVQGVRI